MIPNPFDRSSVAADPATAPEVLAELARDYPELHPIIAANPAVYPGLLEWMSQVHAAASGDAGAVVSVSDSIVDGVGGETASPLPAEAVGEPEPPTTSLGRRRWWIALAVATGLSLMLAAGAGGVVTGWTAANRLVVAEVDGTIPEVITVALPEYQPGTSAVMPDVRGLSLEKATQAIVDAGIPAASISVKDRPSAGAVGVIVQQTPAFGATNPTAVQILTSSPAVIPGFAGRLATDVISDLQSLGASVMQKRDYVPGATVGYVTSIDPAPGATVPDSVTIVVADSASTLPMSSFSPAVGSQSAQTDISVGGQIYDTAISLSSGSSARATSWKLGSHVTEIAGSLGLEDRTNSGYSSSSTDPPVSLSVVVRADGAVIARYDVTKGAPTSFVWTVAGVSTLTLEVSSAGSNYTPLIVITPELRGTFEELGKL